MDLQEVGYAGMDCVDLGQLVGTCKCGIEPSGFVKYGEVFD